MITDQFLKAKKSGTPLIAINTPDPVYLIRRLIPEIASAYTTPIAVVQWDSIRGFKARTKVSGEFISELVKKKCDGDHELTTIPVESVKILADSIVAKGVVFALNAHMYLKIEEYIQAVWNLREMFKNKGANFVMVGPEIILPPELKNDVLLLDDEYPSDGEIIEISHEVFNAANMEFPADKSNELCDALRGLSAFATEQAIALNLDIEEKTVNVDGIWDRKVHMVNETPGLRIYTGSETHDSLGGCESVKKFMKRILQGNDAPNLIVFIDEGEKMFAGATHSIGDNTGVSQDFLGTLLSYMEDHEADGVIFVGPPGTAKSAMAKTTGNEGKIPTVILDMGGMKTSALGESESRIREAFKVINSIGNGKVFFVMTCNKIVSLPPELKSRFSSGTFYFDLPSSDEREKIFDIYLKKYELSDDWQSFDSEGWTGREIRNVCRLAWRQKLSLEEASKFIVPIFKSEIDSINSLRKHASGVFLSANVDGVYLETPEIDEESLYV